MISLALTPQGHLIADELADVAAAMPEASTDAVRVAFSLGSGAGLLWLAGARRTAGWPMVALYWRELAGLYLSSYCQQRPAGESRSEGPVVAPPPEAERAFRCLQAPPMRGLEYLTAEAWASVWAALDATVCARTRAYPGGAEAWLAHEFPDWHLVGRVTFHLAENKKDPAKPFAFLATYISGLTPAGQPRHVPLQQAIAEYAAAEDRATLVRLLEPVSRAAERSAWAKQMLASQAIYRPQAWTPAQALQFLQQVPQLESSGVSIRIPDWWQPKAPPRAKVSVKVGGDVPSALGVNSLLSFDIAVTLDGEPLTPEELKQLKSAEGLVMIRGRWIEADAARLDEAVAHWQEVQQEHPDGVDFLAAMRLLAGAPVEAREHKILNEEVRPWTGLSAGPWLQDILSHLRDPATLPAVSRPVGLTATLRPYQAHGVAWLHFMTELGLGACLADDMGLGKTLQVLTLLLHLKSAATSQKKSAPPSPPSLLVAPASLLGNWMAEAEKFTPGLRVIIAHSSGGSEASAAILADLVKGRSERLHGVDLVITTYGLVARTEKLRSLPWRIVILDEAQAIKNPSAAQSRAVKDLKARQRIALTGTPVENRLGDLWSLFDFVNPGLLGTAPAFNRFLKTHSTDVGVNFSALRTLVRPYLLRRLKTDKALIADLPDKTELTAWCLLSKPQAALYQRTVDQLAKTLETVEAKQRRGVVLAALMAFKQICNHPDQRAGQGSYDPKHSGKFQRLAEICQPIAERQERVLIFTQFTEIIPALRQFLTELFGRDGLVLTGETPIKQRRQLVETFQAPEGPPFFLLSLKAGGTGLTLTAANHVIHFDRWWNPAVENQATDRAFRIGQKKNVLVHKCVCRGTVEERIDQMITDKKGLAEGVLADGAEVPLTEMSDAELIAFVSLDLSSAGE